MESDEAMEKRLRAEYNAEMLASERRRQQQRYDFAVFKNSALCGHIIILTAIILHAIAFFCFQQRIALWGIAFAMLAIVAAWLQPVLREPRLILITSAAGTAASWLIALGWALHLSRLWN